MSEPGDIHLVLYPRALRSLLVRVPEGSVLPALPPLAVPFDREDIQAALNARAIRARVYRAGDQLVRPDLRMLSQVERQQREHERQRQAVVFERQSPEAAARERAAVAEQKLAAEAEARLLRLEVDAGSQDAGVHRRLAEVRNEIDRHAAYLGAYRRAEKVENRRWARERVEVFWQVARDVLDPAVFRQLEEETARRRGEDP